MLRFREKCGGLNYRWSNSLEAIIIHRKQQNELENETQYNTESLFVIIYSNWTS